MAPQRSVMALHNRAFYECTSPSGDRSFSTDIQRDQRPLPGRLDDANQRMPATTRTLLPTDLPVAEVLGDVVVASRTGAVVVTAPPGSGKTMLVPAAVLDDLPPSSRLILLQPRRLAARSVAHQIARLRDVPLGGEVGYQVRFDARVSRDTRLIVETTGIMLRRLLGDIGLDGIAAVVLDEFHERTVEMDLVLGLLVRLRQTLRPDLRIIVMSATLAAEPVARLLGAAGQATGPGGMCPIITAEGRVFPVEMRFSRRGEQRDLIEQVTATVPEALRATTGHVLVFLPGVGEIMRCERELAAAADRQGHAVLTLFGDMPPEQQDRVLTDMGRRKIILATNVAETSLTIPGITAVIDSGLARQLRVSPATGLPRLELIPISQASSDQRAGRAGRTGPGICWRLWDEASHHHRPRADTPESVRGDLASPVLHLLAVGEHRDFRLARSSPPTDRRSPTPAACLHHLGADRNDRRYRRRRPRHAARPRAGCACPPIRASRGCCLSGRPPRRPPRGGGGRGAPLRAGPLSCTVPRGRAGPATATPSARARMSSTAWRPSRPFICRHPDRADPGLEPASGRRPQRAASVAEQLQGHLVDVAGLAEPPAADPAAALMLALLEAFPDRLTQSSGPARRTALHDGRRPRREARLDRRLPRAT
jgi:ATP-dependent helicase HrpB